MKMINRTLILYFLLCISPMFAQQHPDSLLEKAARLIYERPQEAIDLAGKVYDFSSTNEEDKVRALLIISSGYASMRDYEHSLETMLKATSYFDKLKDETQKINILNRIGGQYEQMKIYDKAIEYLDMALEKIDNYPVQDSIRPFLGYNNVMRGFIYREQMNCEIALNYFDRGINAYLNSTENNTKNGNVSIIYYNKGNCLISLGKLDEASESFSLSKVYAEKIAASSLIGFAYKGLAEVNSRKGNYKEAIDILQTAVTQAESVGDLVLNRGLYFGLSNNYLAIKDWENYTKYRDLYLELKLSTRSAERSSINQSLVSITEERETEIVNLRDTYTPIFIGLSILILVILFYLIREVIRSEKKLKKLKYTLKNI